jgi:hypothetical protein
MGKPSPPSPPSPVETARASTSTNVGTSIANSFLGNVNQITPDGSLRYDTTGSYTWNDPYTGLAVNIPTFTATQTLSEQQQALKAQTDAAKYNMAGMANTQSERLSNLLSNEINLSDAPGAGDSNWIGNILAPQTSFGDAGQQKLALGDYGKQLTEFGDAGAITKSYGQTDFSKDRDDVEAALMGRLNPQLQRERGNIEQRLADQGIRYGSAAYTAAMDDYNRQANDLRLGVTAAGGQEQQRMMDMAAQRAGFENAAQQQEYTQKFGRGQFANEAQKQQFQEDLQAGQFTNQAQRDQFMQEAARGEFANAGLAQQVAQAQSRFNAQNMARNQYMSEQYALRNQPINEISALLSGSQINNPNFVNTPNNQIPTTDVAGLINTRFSQDMDIYKQESANYNAMMGGILGMAGGMMKMSDERMKDDIDRVGTVFATDPDTGSKKKLPIYEYSYKDDPADERHVGPMAQDVEKIDRGAVKTRGGIKYIDEDRVMGSILRAA